MGLSGFGGIYLPEIGGVIWLRRDLKNATVEVNVVPHGDGGAPDLNGPLHGCKDG